MLIVPMLLAVAVFSWLLTGWVRRYALARSIMDIPNARSSHRIPTPRGGGVAIVLGFLGCLPLAGALGAVDGNSLLALLPAGALVAVIGFLDDHRHIPARWRLLGHFVAALWLLAWLGGAPALAMPWGTLDLGLAGDLLAVVFLVWLLNLYNFMDGIDGIAGLEAISVCLGGALCGWFVGEWQLVWLPLILGMAAAGFLVWNFPPARIFMGDAGSGFLGLILGGLALQAGTVSAPLIWSWLILLGVFVVDATFTLIHRLMRGERVYEAHRSHAYQRASRRYGSHLRVSLAVAAINVLWLMPLALLVALGHVSGLLALIVAYAPIVLVVAHLGAGRPDEQDVS
ncbi:glycosyltransferase family 4 protein [Pseudomonas nicosulfuronedens]|uniref:Glycosyltransferase family 4 protein n=1 Tax=Pseudomonas nicosulfuronedens TaxID=2571105 RepID=A0A5R9RD56_9PSED|nr:glycosyltransferase family 4 protein [Pseudomonas nicosulfuronedens]MDH1010520.1 glycosyltransferase family 4 protein [Pseudomonas nicosulfuronedens]MDH1979614.1 glycosyltransferase family 4 protein [Pseudomonas nicosulfuronedens]MDH2028049.1 glycosyltransferase family 4 protein [Pseudomonas nicosulfuronedens]TLX80329.1 glycosyltransferase family 4 protein [Pseudomonas nicosulfuronedens]